MTADQFTAWMEHMGWNNLTVAEELQLSRNTVASYRKNGAPEHIGLACTAIAAGMSEWTGATMESGRPVDPFSHHEALHMASVMSDFFERNIASHTFVSAHSELSSKAEKIACLLGEFYQAVGNLRE